MDLPVEEYAVCQAFKKADWQNLVARNVAWHLKNPRPSISAGCRKKNEATCELAEYYSKQRLLSSYIWAGTHLLSDCSIRKYTVFTVAKLEENGAVA